MKKYIFLFTLIIQPVLSIAQYLANPSFEGIPGIALTPPDWQPFDPASTPDTEPLECDNFPASDGDTYITLVARGTDSPQNPNTVENCQAPLLKSLKAGANYFISMDVASRDDLGHFVFGEGFKHYTSSVFLKVFGSGSNTDKGELLLETGPLLNTEWEPVSFTIKPETEVNYLLFEVAFSNASTANGNVLIDNVIIDDQIPPGEFKIPNVFTPNGDEINDNFEISGLPPYSSLLIYDRSGKNVYTSENYQNDWDGTDLDNNPLTSDTYWYVLITPGLSGKHKGFVYLKRD